jgi:hypothetical protein
VTGSLLRAGGDLLDLATTATVETFRRPAGRVTARSPLFTQDGPDVWPQGYDPTSIVGGRLVAPGVHYSPSEEDPELLFSVQTVTADIGRDDDYTIDLRWYVPNLASGLSQVNVAICVDLDREGTNEDPAGFVFAWDVSLFGGSTYWHRLPKAPTLFDSALNPDYFLPHYDGTFATFNQLNTAGGVTVPGANDIRVTTKDGMLSALWNGHQRHTPLARPGWMDGRTRVGLHIVTLQVDPSWPTYPDVFPDVPLSESAPQITRWSWSEA